MKWDQSPVYMSLPRPNRQSTGGLKNRFARLRKLQRGSNLVFINPVLPAHSGNCQGIFSARFCWTASIARNMLIHISAKPCMSQVDAAGGQRERSCFDLNLSCMQCADHLIILPLRSMTGASAVNEHSRPRIPPMLYRSSQSPAPDLTCINSAAWT